MASTFSTITTGGMTSPMSTLTTTMSITTTSILPSYDLESSRIESSHLDASDMESSRLKSLHAESSRVESPLAELPPVGSWSERILSPMKTFIDMDIDLLSPNLSHYSYYSPCTA